VTTYSIIQKSQLESAHRLDAEYYQPEYLEVAGKVNSLPHETLEDISESIVSFGAYALTNFIEWQDDGIPFIVAENIKEGFISYEGARYISDKTDEILKKSRVREGQVLLSMSGSVGNAAVAYKIPAKLNSNQDIVKIRLKEKFSPYSLAAFLNSKYGRMQVLRLPVGSVQQHIFLWQTKSLLVPIFSSSFTNNIEKIYKGGLDQLEISKSLYSQAEDLLLEELGLKDFKPEEDLSYIVNLSSVKSAHRADSEYFQPKYDKIEKILSRFPRERLEDMSSLISYGTVPTSPYVEKEGVSYIKGENLRDCFIDYTKLVCLEMESTKLLPTKFYLKEDDIIISQMGTVGRAGLVKKQEEGWLFASFTIRVRLKEKSKTILNPLFVTLFIENISRPYYLLRRISQASVRQNTDLPTIKDLKVPILPKPTQDKVADLVRQSHQAGKKAKELLEKAKREVDQFILGTE
jgi:restriction endonuclease S subunit